MKIYIAADHGGFELKKHLKKMLVKSGGEVIDMGNKNLDVSDDYPDFCLPLAEAVAKDPDSLGIVIGRTGNGEVIAANKVQGARAALCSNSDLARKAREDNNANVLSLGADFVEKDTAWEIVNTFITTLFSNAERHKRRVDKIKFYETAHSK